MGQGESGSESSAGVYTCVRAGRGWDWQDGMCLLLHAARMGERWLREVEGGRGSRAGWKQREYGRKKQLWGQGREAAVAKGR